MLHIKVGSVSYQHLLKAKNIFTKNFTTWKFKGDAAPLSSHKAFPPMTLRNYAAHHAIIWLRSHQGLFEISRSKS